MQRIIEFIVKAKIEKFIASTCTIAMIVIMFMNVVLRVVFNFAFNWGDEIVRYLCLFATFFAISATFTKGDHISINVIVENMLPSLRPKLRFLADLASLLFSLSMVCFGLILATKLMKSGQASPALGIPMYLLYMVVPVGMFLSSIQMLIRLFYSRSYQDEQEEMN